MIGEIQTLYNDYKRYMSDKAIKTGLPEVVHLRDENFLYWIKLETSDPTRSGQWVGAKPSLVLPLLNNGTFNQSLYRFDPTRSKALLHVPVLLRNPNCIHVNLRHAERGQGGIQGRHVYVEYYGKKTRKVAFTTWNEPTQENRLVSSFWTYHWWVVDCAKAPAVYVKNGSQCTCCAKT